eukprot:3572398-Prorocentrum_lima.AAC.1
MAAWGFWVPPVPGPSCPGPPVAGHSRGCVGAPVAGLSGGRLSGSSKRCLQGGPSNGCLGTA